MSEEEVHQILSTSFTEEPPQPSSGFASAIMAQVWRQAEEPPPLLFPWRRFRFGLAASLTAAGAGTVVIVQSKPVWTVTAAEVLAPFAAAAPELWYAAAATGLSLGLAALSRILIRA